MRSHIIMRTPGPPELPDTGASALLRIMLVTTVALLSVVSAGLARDAEAVDLDGYVEGQVARVMHEPTSYGLPTATSGRGPSGLTAR